MRRFLTIPIYLLFSILIFPTTVKATDPCNCNLFHDYMDNLSEPMYSVSGTVINAGFILSNFCSEGNGEVDFVWKVDGNVVKAPATMIISSASTGLNYDFQYAGTYEVCLIINYRYKRNGVYINCSSEQLCVEITVDGPTYEPCEAAADFNGTVSGSRINLSDQSTTAGSGMIISRKWTIYGPDPGAEFIYYGKNVQHLVSSEYYSSVDLEVCEDIMVINEVTGECCTDTKCITFEVEPTSEDCSMDPEFSYTCFVDDCIYRFNGSRGGSTRNVKSWYWDFGDGATSTKQRPMHMYQNPGQYEICLTVVGNDGPENNCCHNTVCRTITFDCEGVDLITEVCDEGGQGPGPGLEGLEQRNPSSMTSTLAKETALEVAPNPAGESTTVTLNLKEENNKVELRLLDVTGKVKKTYLENNSLQKGSQKIRIDLGGLEKGTYLLQFRTNEKMETEPIIVN